ncbi:DUF3450 domain-containing protein [Halodesulfovibrio sp. MK-HDV]|jgi:uncharacterized protein DUF3450|uniref:DUF3450 domain-containing protein n=1 Tax=Halodesulfovibrio sp. MK-HDV TaxID=2599925 RepID=UPI0013712CE0|nr:DUF3450 domain-containing protein [Halodesulfovibrio sp. MK-HDV]KAF1074884.1 hypothetical protein MKHDV_02436 [Halodesulfovibrio sp. MK-HDV]
MYRTYYIALLFLAGQLLSLAPAYASSKQAQSLASGTIAVEQKAQKKISAWQQEKHSVIAQINNKQVEFDWLTHQKNKYSRYIKTLEGNIAEMKRQQQELEMIANAVTPLLENTVARLEFFIDEDQPFLSKERQERMSNIKKALADPHLAQAEQLRRVLETLEVETGYGSGIEIDSEDVVLEGQPLRAETVRAGRLGYYCVSPDKQQVGIWSPVKKEFVMVADSNKQAVLSLRTIARRKQIVEVTPLPLAIEVTSVPTPSSSVESVASRSTSPEKE